MRMIAYLMVAAFLALLGYLIFEYSMALMDARYMAAKLIMVKP